MSGPYPDNGRDAYEDMSDFYAANKRRNHDDECESELTSHGQTPCRCAERCAAPTRQQLLDFVKEVAELSLLVADNDREFKLIQRARTLVGQPEF